MGLGSVLGPLYGVAVATPLGSWRGIFWLNLPLVAVAIVLVWRAVPGGPPTSAAPRRTDLVGGLLLAVVLGAVVVALYNPDPERSVLPSWGWPVLAAAAAVTVLFVLWAAPGADQAAGPDRRREGTVLRRPHRELVCGRCPHGDAGRRRAGRTDPPGQGGVQATLVLTRFLIALPIGAVLGGLLLRSGRLGERVVAVGGLLLAALAYLLIAGWPTDVLAARYSGSCPGWTRTWRSPASASAWSSRRCRRRRCGRPRRRSTAWLVAVVVARTMGMLIGVAALTAWGLHRFHSLTAQLDFPLVFGKPADQQKRLISAYADALRAALRTDIGRSS